MTAHHHNAGLAESSSAATMPDYAQLARHARRLAQKAGEQLREALGVPRQVRWKLDRGRAPSAVSDLDDAIERMLRASIRTVFPSHAIVGEEHEDEPSHQSPFTWVIDPIDGTTNFTNGLPLYAVSIGVLQGGTPVAGAIWCASTHRLHAGVYHAMLGGTLCLDDEPLQALPHHALRGVVSEPGGVPAWHDVGDARVIGSAATECAWVAAGVLRAAVLRAPRLWDVAAGILLARAAGCDVHVGIPEGHTRTQPDAHWEPFDAFPHESLQALHEWSRPVVLGRIGTVLAPAREVQS